MKTIALLLLVPAVAHADDIAMPDDQVSAPAPEPVKPPAKWLEPYGAIAGGMRVESLHLAPGQSTGSQNPTVAVSRLGVRGGVGPHITFASELEAAMGAVRGDLDAAGIPAVTRTASAPDDGATLGALLAAADQRMLARTVTQRSQLA